MQQTQKQFLSVRQAADALGVTTQTIRKLIWDGQLAGVKVGERGWRIPATELARLHERAVSGADIQKASA